uniref:Protein PsbN n=1 Tax=Radula cf. acuta/lacerata Chantanaorrapint & Promma 3822 PSU TaxID=2980016 RepID=A0A9Y1DJE5_9MARC|nr:PsbN [Radula cf. acuta/lacerata Chantanaorrapint & Promma 3822 PSU]
METATFITITISCLLISFTGYASYTAFGKPSNELRNPFEEHEE